VTPLPYTLQSTAFGYPAAVVVTEYANVWDDPAYAGNAYHLQTQLVAGEHVVIVSTLSGEWYEIIAVDQPSSKNALGYPGWVEQGTLANDWVIAERHVVVTARSTFARADRSTTATAFMQLSIDVRLPALDEAGGWVQVLLPDRQTAWVDRGSVRVATDPNIPVATEDTLRTAELLVGTPYMWGGTTWLACDCSGFVYRVLHAHGVTIARDSRDQATGGRPISTDALLPGDLVFTGRPGGSVEHVAFYTGDGQILDCGGGDRVRFRPLSDLTNAGYEVKTARAYGH
jgi:cell wall-associated NlpC family hydrolase